MTLIEIAFKHIPIGTEFGFKGQMYTKTNFNRGYYHKEGRKILKRFKKSALVKTNNEYFDWVS